MKRYIGVLSILAAIGLVYLLTLLNEEPEEKNDIDNTLRVSTLSMEPTTVVDRVTGHGQVEPRWQTTIASEVDGRVVTVSSQFLSGVEFRKGEVLATVAASEYQLQLANAQKTLASAKRVLSEEQQRAQIAADDWKASGFAGTPSALVLRQPQLEEASAAIRAAQAEVEKAEYDLDRTRITAPYDGVVINRSINPGDLVQKGSEIGRVYDRSLYDITIPLSLSEIARLPDEPVGKVVHIRARHSERTWQGTISRVEQVVDEQNRWRDVVVETRETEGLLPGMFVTAEFEGKSYDNVYSVPENFPSEDGYLWYVDPGNRLQRFAPEILFQENARLFVQLPFATEAPIRLTEGKSIFLPGIEVNLSDSGEQ